MRDVCIYTRSDSNYFPGLVALINSLNRLNIDYPIYLVDTGLSEPQKNLVKNISNIKTIKPDVNSYNLDESSLDIIILFLLVLRFHSLIMRLLFI